MSTTSRLILSTCGTSLLTNEAPPPLRRLLTETANSEEGQLQGEQLATILEHVQKRRRATENAGVEEVRAMSAELNGLVSLYGGQLPAKPRDHHVLLHTDTFQGQAVARILELWLSQRGCSVELQTFQGLSTRSVKDFHHAMAELVGWMHQTLPGYREKAWEVIFNLTGGFKSINGFLQAAGMFYADKIVYLFESGGELITIPRLPAALSLEETLGENREPFRRIAAYGERPASEAGSIPETMLLQLEGRVALSAWGELLWAQVKSKLYQQELQPSLSAKLQFSDLFKRDARHLTRDRLVTINERLDDLARCLDGNFAINPRSLDFKPLQGRPVPGSTHECDAWADGDVRRLFGHFEDNVFVIDTLGRHL